MNGPYPRKPENTGGGAGTMAGRLADEAARNAEATQLETVRAAAEKWAGAIATIIGLFALSGIIKGPDDFAKVAMPWQIAIPIALTLAVGCGLTATLFAARAAYGLPKEIVAIGPIWTEERLRATKTAAKFLYAAIGGAVASFAAFAFAVGVLWFAPRAASPTSMTLLTTSTTLVCGQVKSVTMAQITIADVVTGGDVTTEAGAIRFMTAVSSCPVLAGS